MFVIVRPGCCTVAAQKSLFRGRRLLEQDRQAREPSQEAAAPAHLLVRNCQPELRVPSEQRGEGDLPLDARQWRPEANVDAFAERYVPVGIGPRDIEDIRVCEPFG